MYMSSLPQPRGGRDLDRQIRVSRCTTYCLQGLCNVWPNDGYVANEARNSREKVAKQNEYAVQLDHETDECPAHEDERYAGDKGEGAFPLLLAGEEGDRLGGSDDERESDYEEYLFAWALGTLRQGAEEAGKAYIAHGQPVAHVSRTKIYSPLHTYMARSKNIMTPPIRKSPPIPSGQY